MALTAPKVARSLYQNIGTITSESMVQVQLGRRRLGQVEESFMNRLRPGDVFVLNGRCFRLVSTHLLTARVKRADSAMPTIPRWYANKMPLASGLAAEVVRLRTAMAKLPPADGVAWLQREYHLSKGNADALGRHFALQAEISAIPTAEFFLMERYREPESDRVHYFFHALIGRSANDALSRIIAQRIQETKGGNALVTIDDYGFLLSLRSFQEMNLTEWQALFRREGAETAMRTALAESSLVKWMFRGVSQTGLMVPRRVHGAERGARAMQFSAEIIFDVLRRYEPGHPLLEEAYADVTLRFLDLPRAIAFLDQVAALPWDLRELDRVSPFSFGIYVSKIKETMTLEDPETTIERLYHEMYGRSTHPPPTLIRPDVWLDNRRALWLSQPRLLVVADLHWGYAVSHRAQGNLLPMWGDEEIAARLRSLLADYQPAEMFWLGDSLHALSGRAAAEAFLRDPALPATRVLSGNHDVRWSARRRPACNRDGFSSSTMATPARRSRPDCVEIVGHHHPAVTWYDGAGGRLKLPALVDGPRRLILPAFSPWAGGTPWNPLPLRLPGMKRSGRSLLAADFPAAA